MGRRRQRKRSLESGEVSEGGRRKVTGEVLVVPFILVGV